MDEWILETRKEQWELMTEDKENYKRFMENDDLVAFDRLVEKLIKQLSKRGEIMYDLTKIRKIFNEVILSRLSEEVLKRNNIGEDEELIREELFKMREIIEVPFGSIIYFLAVEDEKPVLYVEIASRMGSDDLYVIEGDSYECYDIYDGYPPQIKDNYFDHLKNIKETKSRFKKKVKGE